ncbi:hypothetical protein [Pseudomonas oryzihabitans]|uniref:hypothetical protein n=1 Tax=Pseudomonas oryzihabitans TaxID=47885 RepID=UPI0028959289|nr:hypothetical protein [Pseudomonas oryzihabitans]MDT3719478.1 hypothetical protein [Pseudomonas oryzihabitans]
MLARLINIFDNSRLLPLFVVTICIQGGVVVSQFLIAPFVDPSLVGVVRSLETVIALVVLAGSLGMQSIAIRDTSACLEMSSQSVVLRQVFLLVGATSCIVILGIFIAHEFVITTAISYYVLTTSGLVLLTNLVRVTTGFAQGAKVINKIYLSLTLATGMGVILHVVLTRLYGVGGWIVARYITEITCLLVVWWRLRAYVVPAFKFSEVKRSDLASIAGSGLIINASLFVRLLVDSLPVLTLTAMRIRTDEIGFFGLAILSLLLGQLPLAIIAQRMIPDLVEVLDDKSLIYGKFRLLLKSMVLVSSAMTASLITGAAFWLIFVGGQYAPTAKYVLILAMSLPFKAIMLASGTMLVVLRVFHLSLKINMLEGLLVFAILYFLIPVLNGWAGVLAYVGGSLLSAILFYLAVVFQIKKFKGTNKRARM